jgi:protein-L-isoaspartate(D-aspartate) O-methyltransferase
MPGDQLRELLERLEAAVAPRSKTAAIRETFARVPRHLFVEQGIYLPDDQGGLAHRPLDKEVLEYVYSDRPLVVRQSPLTTCSQPALLAIMLGYLDLVPGLRILEIGTGTGYFAALLAEMVGNRNPVTTVEIQPDVAAGAREALDKAGYPGVSVCVRDGFYGCPEREPYDRIVVSTCAADVSPSWLDQLAADGRLLVPLKHGGVSIAPLTQVMKNGTAKVWQWAGFGPALGELYQVGPWNEEFPTAFPRAMARGKRPLFPVPADRKGWLFDFHFFLALNDPAVCWVDRLGVDWLGEAAIGVLYARDPLDLLAIEVDQGWCFQTAGSGELGERLVRWFREFTELSAPGVQEYEIEFSFPRRATGVGLRRISRIEWIISRQWSEAKVRLPT